MSEGLTFLAKEKENARDRVAKALDQCERNEFDYHWNLLARPSQLPPPGSWRVWMIMAGRGFGKTRAGSEWVRAVAESHPEARIALVCSSLTEARSVMIEGESGVIACSPPGRRPVFEPSLRRLRFPNGAMATLYSAAEPESLRGPQHSHAWCDEIGKWPLSAERATRCWDNLLMGLRITRQPRVMVTTTPRTVPLIDRLMKQAADGSIAVTRGSTYDNIGHLPARFFDAIEEEFSGTHLARQEIDGEYLRDIEGALWNRSRLEASREVDALSDFARVVVAVDPPASSAGDECGIIVAALGLDGVARVLADCSVAKAAPDQWASTVSRAALNWEADCVVAEANQGGAMVESVLRAADQNLPIKLVYARRGKAARAEPVAALYATGRVLHRGRFARLEDQMCGLMAGGEYAGPGRSPDRADALVWALSELMLSRQKRPSIRAI
ncbi:MAG: terminase family protein [Erythrobacter sp.]|uniref:DNA-packaging protein n=1 Tax=Erythrobacter sp. TaxID=1042 RepID=UPI00263841BE|nr:terminase family protein [Erythrobacter sp.]MDJ0979491.1 terminase family protein [Erythrobacter sp.]